MSRIGKKPVEVPGGVKVALDPRTRTITVEGPKGKLAYTWHPAVSVSWDEGEKKVVCSIPEAQMNVGEVRALWGSTRARIQNIVTGVARGFTRKLEIIGVGWNAKPQGKSIQLNVGYCHPVVMAPPDGVQYAIEGPIITITGPDKHLVGQFAANVRAQRPPEPYKGKGIRYLNEYVIRKQGKVFGT